MEIPPKWTVTIATKGKFSRILLLFLGPNIIATFLFCSMADPAYGAHINISSPEMNRYQGSGTSAGMIVAFVLILVVSVFLTGCLVISATLGNRPITVSS